MTEQQPQVLEGELSPRQKAMMESPVILGGDMTVFGSSQGFVVAQRMAQALASSSMVPRDYQSQYWDDGQWKQNPAAIGNCIIALELASRLEMSPLMVMQNVDMIYGRPSFRGKLVKGLVDTSGRFEGLSKFEWKGEPGTDEWGARLYAIERSTGERINGPWVDWKMVKGEGWLGKKGSKWATMPELMFMYRAASFFGNANVPERLLGLPTTEELEDIAPLERRVSVADLNARLERAASEGDASGQEVTEDGTRADQEQRHEEATTSTRKRQPRNKPAAEPLPQKEEGVQGAYVMNGTGGRANEVSGTQPATAESASAPEAAEDHRAPGTQDNSVFNFE